MKLNKRQYEKLDNIYKKLIDIDISFRDLQKYNLSLSDYREFIECYNYLGNTGKAITYYSNIVSVFEKFNFNTNLMDDGVNFIVTLDDKKHDLNGKTKEEILNYIKENKLTINDLKNICKENFMETHSKWKKTDYIDAIIFRFTNKTLVNHLKFIDSFIK